MTSTDLGRFAPRGLVVSSFGLDDGALRIRVIGDLEAAVVASFRDQMTRLTNRAQGRIELDLAGVAFCDAAGGRELLTLRAQAAERQVPMVLVAAHPAVRLLLHLIGEDAFGQGLDGHGLGT
ncbi:STAS domain-containing protein [Couchioplanes azureus]|uniref:STAS domain-containing protein n=1 Tax=Couchioplanes caeruleus TaxID=56438 RepID=UPI00167181C1|nr:STAS domain-containing protein [Couchioplanes caeruleus]